MPVTRTTAAAFAPLSLMPLALAFVAALGCGDGSTTTSEPRDTTPPSAAALTLDRAAADLGSVVAGTTDAGAAFVVSNAGGSASGAIAASLAGDGFAIASDRCAGVRLAPGRSCVVVVTFHPTRAGATTATLTLRAEPGGEAAAALSGVGLAPGALAIAATPADLGAVAVGASGATRAQVTVSNGGDVASGALRVRATSADFVVSDDGCSGKPLAPGASCAMAVAFTPTERGARTVALEVSASPGGRVTTTLGGIGLALARLVTTAPARVAFGSVVVGASGTPATLTLTNVGEVASDVIAGALSGADAAAFAVSGCGAALAPGAACDLTVAFTPRALGPAAATLAVGSAAGAGTFTFALAGSGVGTALAIRPTRASFAATGLGADSAPVTFTVTAAAHPSGAVATRAPADFRVTADTCAAASLAPGASCAVTLVFAPSVAGATGGQLDVTSPASGAVSAGLDGVGLTPGHLALSPAGASFGAVPVGRDTPPEAFVLTNDGGQPSGLVAIALTGDAAAQFAVVGTTCPPRLQPAQSCAIAVRFAPDAIGAAHALLAVATPDASPVTAPLDGAGVDPAQLRVSPATYAFAATPVGTSATQTFTVENASAAATGAVGFAVSGPNASELAVTSDCGALDPNATCTLTVAFTPRALGARAASVTVSATPGGAARADVTGTGGARVDVSHDGAVLAAPLDLGPAILGASDAPEADLVVTNHLADAAPFDVGTSFGTPARFAVVGDSCAASHTIAAGGACTLRVRFAPTELGPAHGTLSVRIGATTFDRVVVELAGLGIPSLAVAPAVVGGGPDLGDVPRHTSATRAFSVTNPADAPATGVLGASLAGDGWALTGDDCSGHALAAGETCTVEATFSADDAADGPRSATLTVRASPGGPVTLALAASAIAPIGAAPSAITLTPASVDENAPAGTTVGVLATSDADADDSFRYEVLSGAGFALATDGADTRLTTSAAFDHEATPTRTIRVRVTDNGGQRYEQDLVVTIGDVDEPTVLGDDAFTVIEDAAATTLDVLGNDADPDTALAITAVTQPAAAAGTVAIAADKQHLTFTPAADYCDRGAPATFTYTVNGPTTPSTATVALSVTCVDDPGVAVNDSASATEGGPALLIDVLANDSDVDGNKLIASVTQPAEGGVVIVGDGAGLTYQPARFPTRTSDVFTYTLVGGSVGTVTVAVAITTTGCQRAATLGTGCQHGGTCSDGGTLTATCACVPGWEGPRCESDRDECALGTATCDAHATCRNLLGAYTCACQPGWKGDGTTCSDVDECAAGTASCGGHGTCTNTPGGYTCGCAAGYEAVTLDLEPVDPDPDAPPPDPDEVLVAPTQCLDVDECANGTSSCTGEGVGCVNTDGSFYCTYSGCHTACPRSVRCDEYPDHVCTEARHECSDPDDPNGVCVCAEGYTGGPTGGCFDVDECKNGDAFVPEGALCVNTDGGFDIVCPDGTVASGAGLPCDDVDECAEGLLACGDHQVCVNEVLSARCACADGYEDKAGDGTCTDIDECNAGASPCGLGGACTNTAGSYTCACPAGFVAVGDKCYKPVANDAACDAHAHFVATGVAHCECKAGYVGDGLRCGIDFASDGHEGALAPPDGAVVVLSPGVHQFTTVTIGGGTVIETYGRGVLDIRAQGDIYIGGFIWLRGEKPSPTGAPTRTGTDFGTDPGTVSGTGAPGGNGPFYPCGRSICVVVGGHNGGGGGAVATAPNTVVDGGGGGGWAGGGGGSIQVIASDWVSRAGPGGGPNGGGPAAGGVAPGIYGGGNGGFGHVAATWYAFGAGGGSIGADAVADLGALTTFRPGSGGGGGAVFALRGTKTWTAFSGGGGGGAVRFVSATRLQVGFHGVIDVRGGGGGDFEYPNVVFTGAGGGSGGIIYLAAPDLLVQGQLIVGGGTGQRVRSPDRGSTPWGGGGGMGRIRLSADPAHCDLSLSSTSVRYLPPHDCQPRNVPGYVFIDTWPY